MDTLGSLVCGVFVFCHFSICCPGTGVVLDCLDSGFLSSSLLFPVTRGPLFYPFFVQITGTLSCTPLFFMFENRLLEAPDHAWMRHIT